MNGSDGRQHAARRVRDHQRHRTWPRPARPRRLPAPTVLGGSCVTLSDVAIPLLTDLHRARSSRRLPTTLRPDPYARQVRSLATGQQSQSRGRARWSNDARIECGSHSWLQLPFRGFWKYLHCKRLPAAAVAVPLLPLSSLFGFATFGTVVTIVGGASDLVLDEARGSPVRGEQPAESRGNLRHRAEAAYSLRSHSAPALSPPRYRGAGNTCTSPTYAGSSSGRDRSDQQHRQRSASAFPPLPKAWRWAATSAS